MSKETLTTLDQTLVDILTKATEAAGKATDFLTEQTPMVIIEMLNWYFAYNLIMFVSAMAVMIYISLNLSKWFTVKHAPNWAYDEDGDGHVDPRVMIPILGILVALIPAFIIINLQWLKIWIAPKLFLIEKLAELTGGK